MKKILIILVLIFLSGCHQDNRVRIVLPAYKVDRESPEYRAAIKMFRNGWTIEEYKAEIEYLKYLDSQE